MATDIMPRWSIWSMSRARSLPGLTLVGEIWTMTNFDPADTVTLASADAALAWLVSERVQLDLGANFGLTRSTADLELYAGASVRF